MAFYVHCALCFMFFAYANMHTCTLQEEQCRGRGTLTYLRAAHRAHFSPQQMTCHVFIISARSRSFQLITLSAARCALVAPASLHAALFLSQLAGELIITYHSWRTYPKSKHLTLLIRLMPVGCTSFSPGYMQRATCHCLLLPATASCSLLPLS